ENIPRWWIRPEPRLATGPGLHRFVWDLHGAPVPSARPEYPIAAIPGDTPREPRGPWALPGRYQVTLTVDGQVRRQALPVGMAPRGTTPLAARRRQLAVTQWLADARRADAAALERLEVLRAKAAPAQAEKLGALAGGVEPWWGEPRRSPTL